MDAFLLKTAKNQAGVERNPVNSLVFRAKMGKILKAFSRVTNTKCPLGH